MLLRSLKLWAEVICCLILSSSCQVAHRVCATEPAYIFSLKVATHLFNRLRKMRYGPTYAVILDNLRFYPKVILIKDVIVFCFCMLFIHINQMCLLVQPLQAYPRHLGQMKSSRQTSLLTTGTMMSFRDLDHSRF